MTLQLPPTTSWKMLRARNAIDTTQLDTTEAQAADEAQVGESSFNALGGDDLALSPTLAGLADEARFMGGGPCGNLMPQFTCVAYDGSQGGLCPPVCHAPGGGCGCCEQDFGGTCHCSY